MAHSEADLKLLERQGIACACCKTPFSDEDIENFDVCYWPESGPSLRAMICPSCVKTTVRVKFDLLEYRQALEFLERMGPRSWDGYFLRMARLAATMSKDPSSQVGAVLVRERQVIATGFNGFPRGVNDNAPGRMDRPTKYQFVVHAEENALLSAARNGSSTRDTIIYVTPLFPCSRCATSIVQAGVREVVTGDHKRDNPRWREEFEQASVILSEGGVLVRGPT